MAFQRLPKEAEPSQLLEERVVRSLREEGILGSGLGQGADGGAGVGVDGRDDARPGVGRWFRPWMATAAAAAVGGSLCVGNGSGSVDGIPDHYRCIYRRPRTGCGPPRTPNPGSGIHVCVGSCRHDSDAKRGASRGLSHGSRDERCALPARSGGGLRCSLRSGERVGSHESG